VPGDGRTPPLDFSNRFLEFSDPVGFSSRPPFWPGGEKLLGFGVQRKLRAVSLPATWSRACGIDAANLRGRFVIMVSNLNGFGFRFPPMDFDSGPV
jgi:hypothetical protein